MEDDNDVPQQSSSLIFSRKRKAEDEGERDEVLTVRVKAEPVSDDDLTEPPTPPDNDKADEDSSASNDVLSQDNKESKPSAKIVARIKEEPTDDEDHHSSDSQNNDFTVDEVQSQENTQPKPSTSSEKASLDNSIEQLGANINCKVVARIKKEAPADEDHYSNSENETTSIQEVPPQEDTEPKPSTSNEENAQPKPSTSSEKSSLDDSIEELEANIKCMVVARIKKEAPGDEDVHVDSSNEHSTTNEVPPQANAQSKSSTLSEKPSLDDSIEELEAININCKVMSRIKKEPPGDEDLHMARSKDNEASTVREVPPQENTQPTPSTSNERPLSDDWNEESETDTSCKVVSIFKRELSDDEDMDADSESHYEELKQVVPTTENIQEKAKSRETKQGDVPTAIVYLASPKSPYAIAITGGGTNLGRWKEARGEFEVFRDLGDVVIYKGLVPVPSERPSFKFLHIDKSYKFHHEGEPYKNRHNELLPDSVNYFIFQPNSSKGFFNSLLDALKGAIMGQRNVNIMVATEFMKIAYDRAFESIEEGLDTAYETLEDGLVKINNESNISLQESFVKYVDHFISEKFSDMSQILLVFAGAHILKFQPSKLANLIQDKVKEFSLFVFNIQNDIKRQFHHFKKVFEIIASHHPGLSWILIRSNRVEELKKSEDVSRALIMVLNEMDQLLQDKNMNSLRRTIAYLVKHNDIDAIFHELKPFFFANANLDEVYVEFLTNLKTFKEDVKKTAEILKSDFLRAVMERTRSTPAEDDDDEHYARKLDVRKFLAYMLSHEIETLFKIAVQLPDHLRPISTQVVEQLMAAKLKRVHKRDDTVFRYFCSLDTLDQLNPFPQAREQIESMLLRRADELITDGSFKKIPSVLLLLSALSRRQDIAYLESASVTELEKLLADQPRSFLARLHSALEAGGKSVVENLKPHRRGKLKNLCLQLQDHFECLDDIVNDVRNRKIPLSSVRSLLEPSVIECLNNAGLTEMDLAGIRRDCARLRNCYQRYSNLYNKLARFETTRPAPDPDGATELETEGDVSGPPAKTSKHIFEVFDADKWEDFLKILEPESSTLTVQAALNKKAPLPQDHAEWLELVIRSKLFMDSVWHVQVKAMACCNLKEDELEDFVEKAANSWFELAQLVSDGLLPFNRMEHILAMEPDARALSQYHLGAGRYLNNVPRVYQDFRNLSNVRHLITPFITALRFFTIRNKKAIADLHQSVCSMLVDNWNEITLAEVLKTELIATLDKELAIDSDRPETLAPLQFIASLVTDKEKSPLIEWLKNKKERDFEAMGKILQGSLFEAYGQLQTLKTRIAPFLRRKFTTFKELLRVIRLSEEKFSQRHSGRVQEIKTGWLASMLPEIEAAIRASTISPSEDAKEKLQKLASVSIEFDPEKYTVKIRLAPAGELSMEELKQAFQLLDMAALDCGEDLVSTIRRRVELIIRLAEIFDAKFNSLFFFHTAQKGAIHVQVAHLEDEVVAMQKKLDEWSAHWKKIADLPYLALCSRDFLLYVANALRDRNASKALGFLRTLLPYAPQRLDTEVATLVKEMETQASSPETANLFDLLAKLNAIIGNAFKTEDPEVELPAFLKFYGQVLETHFLGRSVVILNVSRQLLVGSSLAAYVSLTRRPIRPTRICFVTANTRNEEIERFMRLWSIGEVNDLFIMVHIERLSSVSTTMMRDVIDRVLPENRARLLLLAQQHHRVQSTKSLGARLGLQSDRLLEIKFNADQLRECFTKLSPITANIHFFTSTLPGCGKSQQAMQLAAKKKMPYSRIAVREGTVEELMEKLKKLKEKCEGVLTKESFLHLDVAHSVSLEFNDILLSLILHGALYDPRKSHLGFWRLSSKITLAVEFSSPYGADDFPIISYLGTHHKCECSKESFAYQLAEMPETSGRPVTLRNSEELILAAKFLELKQAGETGLAEWHLMCNDPDAMLRNPVPKQAAFQLLLGAFDSEENLRHPTFSAVKSMATFLHRHITAMVQSLWFNVSSKLLFGDCERLASIFKLDIFRLLLKVANDSLGRCWSLVKSTDNSSDWIQRQRAMLLLGLDEYGTVTGVNVVGRNLDELVAMFNAEVRPYLRYQSLHFQELNGFRKLVGTKEGTETVLNAIRSLLQLDGTPSSLAKARQLDDYAKDTPAIDRLRALLGQDFGYVLTGDNITKMMFALYRIRCGLPVVAFGEAGVGKSALFRFLFQTLLGHHFSVCNVNSGTTVQDISQMVNEALTAAGDCQTKAFVLLDEMNTSDPSVIAFLKELVLDRVFEGGPLPGNLHLIAAANPYRLLKESDNEASVGLAFRFAEAKNQPSANQNLVYRVNELPRAFYDHIYDFGYLNPDAEDVYIEEICHHSLLKDYGADMVRRFVNFLQKSHREARLLSPDPESAVSLRDTTRAVQLFKWFTRTTVGKKLADTEEIGMQLAIYLAYAFRFVARWQFLASVFGKFHQAHYHMKQASKKIAKMLYEHAHGASIGSGAVALNDALCENLFALFVCVLNGIFVIIVGRPGTSKSLSVEILKLVLSPGNHELRETLGDLPALTELYFQCSPLSTSAGFKALFESAQRLSVDPKTMLAMVVLDELGLADLSPEKPIKVLHSELERKAVLTSGETQQTPYSVVALSNWVVDAAQVNRGILISRKQALKMDLRKSAKELAESLVQKFSEEGAVVRADHVLDSHLECIVEVYHELDLDFDIGGGHFYSMRDFFFCVKNFVCSLFEYARPTRSIQISDDNLIQSVVRNFGGHEKAKLKLRECLASSLNKSGKVITLSPVLDLVIQNIRDSSKKLSVHIARHLMILNRSLIGLQLLNRHVKNQLDEGTGWTVLFGSCFPGDLQVTAVTRKLRQVEQAIRRGGVLVLCHADQLFESLYMVLNQQYWAQGDVTMTQIALGPSIRAIALPDGPFRIIALQDTDVALNRQLMSPAVLSRFEKHELRPCSLLNEDGRKLLSDIETHPVWSTLNDVRRRQLLCGYHEDTLAALALHCQDAEEDMEVDSDPEIQVFTNDKYSALDVTLMRAVNPMVMTKIERDAKSTKTSLNLENVCQVYRRKFILDGFLNTLDTVTAKRLVIMTNTQRHVDVLPRDTKRPHQIIHLFDIQSELELDSLLSSLKPDQLTNPDFLLIVQYDAISGPIEQFQLAKYEIDARLTQTNCRVVFVIHLDPRSVQNYWVFSFGDGWDYVFVDELAAQPGHTRLPLKALVEIPGDRPMTDFLRDMLLERFRSLLQEMLGPVLQTCLENLGGTMGIFFGGVRTALQLPEAERVIELLKECLIAQLDGCKVSWNVLDAVSNAHFDSSSSLTEGLWEVFKQKISKPLAHLLLMSDVWRLNDSSAISLWCDFVRQNFPDRLMVSTSTTALLQVPPGLRTCSQPFGRLLTLLNKNFAQSSDAQSMVLLRWLLRYVSNIEGERSDTLKQAYFCDWISLHLPPHLQHLIQQLPFAKMANIVDNLFEEPVQFFAEWTEYEAEVIAALEHANLATVACHSAEETSRSTGPRMRSWKHFVEATVRQSLVVLDSPTVLSKRMTFVQTVTSIEVCQAMRSVIERSKELSDLWLKLRITKRMFLFNPECDDKLYDLQESSPDNIIECLTDFVLSSVFRPRLVTGTNQERLIRKADLVELLSRTAECQAVEDLGSVIRQCPVTNSLLVFNENDERKRCPRCNELLVNDGQIQDQQAQPILHLIKPSAETTDSLFQDYNKFMLLFEQVAELFIEHKTNSPEDIRELLRRLLASGSKLRVSWRFFTVIVRSIVSNRSGSNVIDRHLSTIACNGRNLSFNAANFLRALLVCADEDVRREPELNVPPRWNDVMLTGEWSVKRIRSLAEIRRLLADSNEELAAQAVGEWADRFRNEDDQNVLEPFLFFVLRFGSGEGDEMRLKAIVNHPQVPEELDRHSLVGEFKKTFNPMSLGFKLLPQDGKLKQIHHSLKRGQPFVDVLPRYGILSELEPQWAPYLARLAVHAADVANAKGIQLLQVLATDPGRAANLFLPGVDNHPYLASYKTKEGRWYVCDCQTLCWVIHCGQVRMQTICGGCKRCLAVEDYKPRDGVRLATKADFNPPKGIHFARNPVATPTYSVRNQKPIVTRLALLLNNLCLLNATIDGRMDAKIVQKIMQTLPLTERINRPNQVNDDRSLARLLVDYITVNLDLLCKLLTEEALTLPDKFRVGHLLMHKLLENQDPVLVQYQIANFETSVAARENFELALDRFVSAQTTLLRELEDIKNKADEASKNFHKAMSSNESLYWMYARRTFSSRGTVQLALARDVRLQNKFTFLSLLVDDGHWAPKLDALVHLGDAIRFTALVRSTLQGKLNREEADGMTIAHGIEKIIEILEEGAVILDRGRPVATGDQVRELFHGFQQLWNSFSQIPNAEHKTFLEFFECQQVDVRVRPDTILRETAPLILILAGNNSPEMTFSCQLLASAVEAANSIAQIDFVKRHCRKGTTRTRMNCSSAAGMAEFDESLYAHVSREQVDRFIVDHVIDGSTLRLAESYAMVAVLGSAGSTVASDLFLDPIPEFSFKETTNTENHLFALERRFLTWQPTQLSNQLEESILVDLEKNRSLGEAKSLLISALSHLLSNTEPLVISQVRKTYVTDVLEELVELGILTERHISTHTLNALNRHVRLQVHQAMSLLKSVLKRMKGDDLFGGRIPQGWDVMMSERLVRETTEMMRAHAENDTKNTLLDMANVIQSSNPVPKELMPDKPLLQAIRIYEGDDWQGIPADLALANLGHALLIAEGL